MRQDNDMDIMTKLAQVFVRDAKNEIVAAGLVEFRQKTETKWDSEVSLFKGESFNDAVAIADAKGFTVTGVEIDGYTSQIKGSLRLLVPFPVLCDVTVKLAREVASQMKGGGRMKIIVKRSNIKS